MYQSPSGVSTTIPWPQHCNNWLSSFCRTIGLCGQLSSVKEIFDEMNVKDIDLISLAKREEEIFTPQSHVPVVLDKSDYCLRMLQRIRDEAHRFAITFNRDLRSKRTLSSLLGEIPGIGKVKRRLLMDKFKDIFTSTK